MNAEEAFYGMAKAESLSANFELSQGVARTWYISTTTTGIDVNTPDARKLRTGGPAFYVINESANDFDITDKNGTLIVTLSQRECALLLLLTNDTEDGTWAAKVTDVGVIAVPAAPQYTYVLCGFGETANARRQAKEYNHVSDIWTNKGVQTSNDHYDHCGAAIAEQGYVVGGSFDKTSHNRYDPDVWVTRTAATVNKNTSCAAPDGTDYYTFSGTDDVDHVSKYDVSGNSWSQLTNLSFGHVAGAAFDIGSGDIQVMAGGSTFSTSSGIRNIVYDTASGTSTVKTNLPLPQRGFCAASKDDDGFQYLMGGQAGFGSLLQSVIRYDPSTDTWVTRANISVSARFSAAAGLADGQIAHCGGALNSTNRLKDTIRYNPDTNVWVTKADMPEQIASFNNGAFSLQSS